MTFTMIHTIKHFFLSNIDDIVIVIVVVVDYLCGLKVVAVHPDDRAADGLGRLDGQGQVLVSLHKNCNLKQ